MIDLKHPLAVLITRLPWSEHMPCVNPHTLARLDAFVDDTAGH
jgi:hypothetical protein